MNKQSIPTKPLSILNSQTIFYLSSFAIAVAIYFIPALAFASDWHTEATKKVEEFRVGAVSIVSGVGGVSILVIVGIMLFTGRIEGGRIVNLVLAGALLAIGFGMWQAFTGTS